MGGIRKIEVSSSYVIGKKDKKAMNRTLEHLKLDPLVEYKVHRCKDKIVLITRDGVPILFSLQNMPYIPTLKALEKSSMQKVAYLDKGALQPILNGADVMCPGVYKCKDSVSNGWRKDDVVLVRIIEHGNIGIGVAMMDLSDVLDSSFGICIRVIHRVNDPLYNLVL